MSLLLARPNRRWIENEHAVAFADAYPVTDGHTLVIPRKHVASIYELNADEQAAVWSLVAEVRSRLLTGMKPDAFNIGVNDVIGCWTDRRARSCTRHSPPKGRCARSAWRHPLDHR